MNKTKRRRRGVTLQDLIADAIRPLQNTVDELAARLGALEEVRRQPDEPQHKAAVKHPRKSRTAKGEGAKPARHGDETEAVEARAIQDRISKCGRSGEGRPEESETTKPVDETRRTFGEHVKGLIQQSLKKATEPKVAKGEERSGLQDFIAKIVEGTAEVCGAMGLEAEWLTVTAKKQNGVLEVTISCDDPEVTVCRSTAGVDGIMPQAMVDSVARTIRMRINTEIPRRRASLTVN
ncbi:MAG: hypothetical protein QM601_02425 [Pseudoxanthomonas sp.]